MPNSAEAVARKIAHNFFKDNQIMKRACGALWKNYRGNLKTLIADSLTAFAAQQVRATWEESADKVAEYMGSGSDVEAEFRRRSQEGR